MGTNLHYEYRNYLLENGNIADKLRLASAGKDLSEEQLEELIDEVKQVQNKDGGISFSVQPGNPSSVKETAEILALMSRYKSQWADVIEEMVKFLVSRQKNDGGFSESLKLDPYIEDKWGRIGRAHYPVAKSVTWLTGKALEALCLAEFIDEERLRRARDFLLYNQYEDGHWPDFIGRDESDPLATGNILLALECVGINSENKVYQDGRAALLQHLKDSVENSSTFDMADLTAVGKPNSELENEVIRGGIELIIQSQNEDGGWAPLGSKKSDPELSSILVFVAKKLNKFA
ncbi:MAG: terpene cyclase/mutase family protein [Candidatus Thorarchaeota archaeon]|nr:terpene cyclase/mutase family protein [Candidatus Thorarchaeota archaeon]